MTSVAVAVLVSEFILFRVFQAFALKHFNKPEK